MLHRNFGVDRRHAQIRFVVHDPGAIFLWAGGGTIALGLLAAVLPGVSTLAIELLIGATLLLGGALRATAALRNRTAPGFRWSLLSGTLAALLGLVLLLGPSEGALTLTILLIVYLLAEGAGALGMAWQLRRLRGSAAVTLVGGSADLILAYILWRGWPDTAAWAIGLLVGVHLILAGLMLLMIGVGLRLVRP